MKRFLLNCSAFCFGFGASMAYAWFDADYIHPVERYEMDKHDYERHHAGDWNAPYMNFEEWQAHQDSLHERFGYEVADAFDWFGLEQNRDSEGKASSRENATWGQD